MVGGGVVATCLLLAVDALPTAALGLVTIQVFGLARLVAAVLFNPVNHRYLMAWEDGSGRLRPTGADRTDRSPMDIELDHIALHHLVRMTVPGSDEEAADWLDVYVSPSRLVVATVDGDDRLLLLSKLTDGRLLVTATETVPPHRRLVLNPTDETTTPRILLRHVERLHSLRPDGIEAVPTGHDTVVEQLRLEWSSWNQLGPFVGPFLAVDPRPQPHLLQVRPSAELLGGLNSPVEPDRVIRHRFRAPPVGQEPAPASPVVTVEVSQPSAAPQPA